jgi:hypothetical protein
MKSEKINNILDCRIILEISGEDPPWDKMHYGY